LLSKFHHFLEFILKIKRFKWQTNRQTKLQINFLTDPKLSINFPKSTPVLVPCAVEIHDTVLTALKHLNDASTNQLNLLY